MRHDMPKKRQQPRVLEADAANDDAAVMQAIAGGDRAAFEKLYKQYFPRLTSFLRRLTAHPHLIDEIINDTMLVVWQKADTYNQTCKVSTWIFAIAYRQGLKALRNLRQEIEIVSDQDNPCDTPGPEQQMSHLQLRKVLESALSELSTEQRSVIALSYYHGMAYDEIARAMKCPINTIKTRMFHARRKLKSLLYAYQ
ncbi:RNA polymerase sigma factor [Herbaspirillum rubrisubalbicans]|uniref:RNA polymerase sigma factor n=3 Tax=Oxalobacteraceae TaxID=75682 RepID=A0ABX9C7T4_9BURK|nr:sigma-70 family RNA polymerase sigma factor [Herbaspirillum rubrisubalbicans]MCP1572674.1 RNA polymerase sigma-70 factor (ECF subfamily) [Herbaspirillum rubrisubalbicans]QJQ01263.1 RNA polymerase subunit sigma [Herbaspirillum rubrisubalbicans Os34]RAM67000.1 RNA polymerase sigma factor [Herbaspirillum rubrisubalbicans]